MVASHGSPAGRPCRGLVREGAFLRFSPATGTFGPADWPVSLGRCGRAHHPALAAPGTRPRRARPGGPARPGLAALITPVLGFRPGQPAARRPPASEFTVVLLDGEYLRQTLVPELARRHFAPSGDSDYGLRIDRGRTRPRWCSRPTPRCPPTDRPTSGSACSPSGRTSSGNPTGSACPGPPAFPRRLAGAAGPRRRSAALFAGEREPGHWRLLVRHRAGSVEAVVAAVRRRNLAVSGGVLALLLASAGLLMVSAQRARRLRDRQIEFVAGVSHELRTPLAAICVAGTTWPRASSPTG